MTEPDAAENGPGESPLGVWMAGPPESQPERLRAIRAWLGQGAEAGDIGDRRRRAVLEAVRGGAPELLGALRAMGCDLNALDDELTRPLQRAILAPPTEKSRAVIKELVRLGAGVGQGMGRLSAVDFAARAGAVESLEALGEAGVDLASPTALADVMDGDLDEATAARVAEALALGGASMKARCEEGRSLLHRACANARSESARVLLSHGADPEAADRRGVTPLMEAVASANEEDEAGFAKLARLLIEAGASMEAKDSSGASAWGMAQALNELRGEWSGPCRVLSALREAGALDAAAGPAGLAPIKKRL